MLIFLSGLAAAALAAWLACRLHLKRQNLLLNLLALLFPLSEIWKQLLLTWANGGVYRWWYFPFQLCSMPLYLLPLRQLLALRLRRVPLLSWLSSVLTDFLADFGLLAGLFAFADQTGMRYPLPALTLHSYLWHFAMIFLGLFLILSGRHSRSSSAAWQGSAYAPGQPLSRFRRAAHGNGGEKVRKSSGFLPAHSLSYTGRDRGASEFPAPRQRLHRYVLYQSLGALHPGGSPGYRRAPGPRTGDSAVSGTNSPGRGTYPSLRRSLPPILASVYKGQYAPWYTDARQAPKRPSLFSQPLIKLHLMAQPRGQLFRKASFPRAPHPVIPYRPWSVHSGPASQAK